MKHSIIERVTDDFTLVESHLKKDGSVPLIMFFHFEEIDKEITELMSETTKGMIEVKDGFHIAFTDKEMSDKRFQIVERLGSCMAALETLGVIGKTESVVITAEATGTKVELNKNKAHKTEVPKDLFLSFGTDRSGSHGSLIKEVLHQLNNISDDDIEVKITLKEFDIGEEGDISSMGASSPLLEVFWKAYNRALKTAYKDRVLALLSDEAKENPTSVFANGIITAINVD